MERNRVSQYLKYLGGVLGGLTLIYYLFFFCIDPMTTVYNVAANTEWLSVKISKDNRSPFVLNHAIVKDYLNEVILSDFTGSMEVTRDANITMERVGEGPLNMIIKCRDCTSVARFKEGSAGAWVYEGEKEIRLTIGNVSERFNDGDRTIFPFIGKIDIGRSVAVEMSKGYSGILNSGEIRMSGYSELTQSYFEAGTSALQLGDFLTFGKDAKDAHGFITIDNDPGMTAAYRIKADKVTVLKPGPKNSDISNPKRGYTIAASLLDRIKSDRFFQGVSLFIAGLLFVMNMMRFVMSSISFRERKPEKQ